MATETFIIDIQTRGTKRSAADVKRIGTSASQVRKTLAFLRNALVAVAAIRVFASLTSSLIEFSDQLLVVKAVTNATTLEFARLRETAKGLGATTRFTAGEAAEGLAFLARAGLDVNEVISGIPATLNLAAAAQLELGNAADIASNLMTSFGRATSELPDIIDTLVFTANNANTTVQQLADGLKLFAPIASQLGISLKDASSAMAVLGDAGIQASLAGTGVRRVLTDLEAPTGALSKALKALNIGFEEVRPSAVGLEGALQRLREANVGASISSVLFGKRGGFVAAQLLRALGPMGDFREELERIEGTAKRVADELESGLGGALRLVRSAIQNLIIAFADLGGEEFLNQFFRGLAEVLRAVARNADDVFAAIKVLIAILVARKVLSFGKAILFTAINLFRAGKNAVLAASKFGLMTASANGLRIALLRIPFVAILTSIGLLITGFVVFRDQMRLMSEDGGTLNDVFTTTSDLLKQKLVDAVNSAGFEFENFGELIESESSKVASGIEGIIAVMFGLIGATKAIFIRVRLEFKKFLLDLEQLQFLIQAGFNFVFDKLGLDKLKFNLSDNTKEARALAEEIQQLSMEVENGGTVFENFIRGGASFLAARRQTTALRLIEERDAAILATETANRRAAQARIVPAQQEVDGGITIEELGLGDDAAGKTIETLTSALRDLENQLFPVQAALNAQIEVRQLLLDVEDKNIDLLVNEEDLLNRSVRAHLGLGDTIVQVTEKQEVFNKAFAQGAISLEELERLSRDVKLAFLDDRIDALSGFERGLLRVNEQFTDIATLADTTVVNAFKGAEDALVEFVQTGKLSFSSLIDQIQADLTRLAVRQAITAPLAGLFGGGGAIAGAGGLADLLSPAGQGGQGLGSFFSGLIGFQRGGGFTVGGGGGTDSELVAFRATPGEVVSVQPKNQQAASGGGQNITLNFNFPPGTDVDSFKRSQTQVAASLSSAVSRAARRNN